MAPAASSGLLGRGVEGEAEEEEPIFSLDLQPLPNTYLGFYREWRKINPGNQVRDFHEIQSLNCKLPLHRSRLTCEAGSLDLPEGKDEDRGGDQKGPGEKNQRY